MTRKLNADNLSEELIWLRGAQGADATQIQELVAQTFSRPQSADRMEEALDRTLASEKGPRDAGGYAFLWEDVFAFDELGRSALEAVADHKQAIALMKKIFATWMRLRDVREPLSRDEFRVLGSIRGKTGSTVSDVADRTGLDVSRVNEVLDGLRRRKYKGGVPLAAEAAGAWSTPF